MTTRQLDRFLASIARELSTRATTEAHTTLTNGVAELGRAVGRSWAWNPADTPASPGWPASPHEQCASVAAAEGDGLKPFDTRHGYVREMTMWGVTEAKPGPQWQGVLHATWDAYRAWYLSEGAARRPDLQTSSRMLARHMPELVPTWNALVRLGGGDELLARFLTGWDMPQFAPGCSQAVMTGERPALVRNYDYNPDLFERVVLSTRYGQCKVIGTSDCLWGLLDGMNDAGLMVSLAFGGAPGSAPGFAIPIIVRYLLETCQSVSEVKSKLKGLPSAMAYNLTVADADGHRVTAYLAPNASPEYYSMGAATNHRGGTPDHPEHAIRLRSVERHEHLLRLLDSHVEREDLADAFMVAPLRSEAFSIGFGTVYTAIYQPDKGTVEYRWPGQSFTRAFEDPSAQTTIVLTGH